MQYSAQMIAATVPLGTSAATGVNAQVQIPGQNLNNARSLNFAGIYYAGSCVPAPVCPLDMTPKIFVSPAGVSGVNDEPTPANCSPTSPYDPNTCAAQVYPLSSFTAFARGDASGNPVSPGAPNVTGAGPLDCKVTADPTELGCEADVDGSSSVGAGSYWRVCLYVRTDLLSFVSRLRAFLTCSQ